MKAHYHVMSGFHGCIPENNETAKNMIDARDQLKWWIDYFRESGMTFTGNLKSGYFESISDNWYAEISDKCYEPECLEDEEY